MKIFDLAASNSRSPLAEVLETRVGNKRHSAAKAETTGCVRSPRRAVDSQPRGRLVSAVWCLALRKCALATRFRQWSARCLSHFDIQYEHGNGQRGRHENGGIARVADRGGSRQAQTLKRGVSRSSIDVGHNDQFKNPDIREFNLIFLNFACYIRWAEIPLLTHNFSKRVSVIRRPSQHKLLCALYFVFLKC